MFKIWKLGKNLKCEYIYYLFINIKSLFIVNNIYLIFQIDLKNHHKMIFLEKILLYHLKNFLIKNKILITNLKLLN